MNTETRQQAIRAELSKKKIKQNLISFAVLETVNNDVVGNTGIPVKHDSWRCSDSNKQ